MGLSLIGGSCLEVGGLDPSILKTERPPRHPHPAQPRYRAARHSSSLRAALSRVSGFVLWHFLPVAQSVYGRFTLTTVQRPSPRTAQLGYAEAVKLAGHFCEISAHAQETCGPANHSGQRPALARICRGTGLYIHTQSVDTTTPAGRAMFGMLGIFAASSVR